VACIERSVSHLHQGLTIATTTNGYKIWSFQHPAEAIERLPKIRDGQEKGNRGDTQMDADRSDPDPRLSASISGSCSAETGRNDRGQAQQKLDEACELIRQTENPYEPHIPDWDEWQPPEYVGVLQPGEIVGYHCRDGEIAALQSVIDGTAANQQAPRNSR